MAELVHRVRLFLSSPGDLSNQRELIKTVCEDLSKDLGHSEGFYIDLWRWESHSYSAIGASPQELINQQIGDDYDIFLGMFGNRFGTATDRFGSGTEEEFNLAADRFKKTGAPEVMFLFFDGKASPSSIDPAQLTRVQNFRKSLTGHGVLYATFDDELSLYRLARYHILQSVRKVLAKGGKGPRDNSGTVTFPTFDPLSEWNKLLAEDTEVHASILMQRAVRSMHDVNSKVVRLTKANSDLIRTFGSETPKLTPVRAMRPELIVRSFNKIVESVQRTNDAFLEGLPVLHNGLFSTMTLCQRSLSMFQSRGELTPDIAKSAVTPLEQFLSTLEGTRSAADTMQQQLATDYFPRSALSVEQRKLRSLAKDLSRILDAGIREGKVLVSMFQGVQKDYQA